MQSTRIAGSFRDPSGYVYRKGDSIYRQVNKSYCEQYDRLVESGLLKGLWEKRLLIPHEEMGLSNADAPETAYRVLKPTPIPFISYPYEWSFSMYKDAALKTLEVELEALAHGMTLKDASAYNIQFLDGHPVFIDTLSFEQRKEGVPWVAYKQFCQHFLAPLALMSKKDIRLGGLMAQFIDGIPLDLTSALLGSGSKFSPRILIHIHAHAKSQRKYADAPLDTPVKKRKISDLAVRGILDSLQSTIRALKWKPSGTEWADYYTFTNYTDSAFGEKSKLVEEFIGLSAPEDAWDLGANNGEFSRIAARKGINTVAFDIDPAAVEKNYLTIRNNNERNILPLVQDLSNPSSALGWANGEREGFLNRAPAGLVMALALIHHIAISNNVPLHDIAKFLSATGRNLIIEFVPKDDSQVKKLLASREDIFTEYHLNGFEKAFSRYFTIKRKILIPGTCRTLFLMTTQRSN